MGLSVQLTQPELSRDLSVLITSSRVSSRQWCSFSSVKGEESQQKAGEGIRTSNHPGISDFWLEQKRARFWLSVRDKHQSWSFLRLVPAMSPLVSISCPSKAQSSLTGQLYLLCGRLFLRFIPPEPASASVLDVPRFFCLGHSPLQHSHGFLC